MDIPTFSCTHWALGSEMIAYVDYGKRLPALMQDCVPKARGARRLMASIACLGAMAAGAITLANAQTSSLKVPSGGDPALSCGQTPNGRAYWTEYGFCDIPVKGPAAANGLIIWSHGMSGAEEQYRFAPPPIVRRLASIGWDVIKINRNNLYEHGWTSSGVRHRDDALERVRAAKAQGYKTVMLAGQSYGGAISLEANARSTDIDGVLALSPGHGSDVGQAGGWRVAAAGASCREVDDLCR